ncbi:MAG TPA: (2Fe-2S) ferredoxin domain-containing protein [Bacteroidales bacterium]|nr:(2Fe-2S) ferredoxin domain-containing protein [Bacteroidales bacterium]
MMEEPGVEITVCMGSSCFSRGNKKNLEVITDYLRETGQSHQAVLKGSHCLGKCVEGPILKINNNQFSHVDESNVVAFLEVFFDSH